MKSIKGWNDWYLHPFTLIYLLAACLNNNLRQYLSALIIVCIHEYGHYYFAKKFNFKIEKVEIMPFGAFLSLEDYGMHHIVEELVMLLGGLVTHFVLYIFISCFFTSDYLLAVNRLVLIFNLLPIYPLDGSKILLLLLSLVVDYYQAIKIQIKVSIMSLSLLIILYHQLGYLIIYSYLIYVNYQYIKEFRFMVIRLYLNRLESNPYKKIKLNYKYRFYRPYNNYYLIDDHYYNEKQVLYELIKNLKNS